MDIQADAVAERMAERAGITRLDVVSRQRVDFFAHRAGADGVKRQKLRVQHGLVKGASSVEILPMPTVRVRSER